MTRSGNDRRNDDHLQKEIVKEAMKEGVKEWLDDKFQKLGKWSAGAIAAAALAAVAYLILFANGWHKS